MIGICSGTHIVNQGIGPNLRVTGMSKPEIKTELTSPIASCSFCETERQDNPARALVASQAETVQCDRTSKKPYLAGIK